MKLRGYNPVTSPILKPIDRVPHMCDTNPKTGMNRSGGL